MDGHEEFRELCAISVSEELTDDERKKLDEHLKSCPSCRTVFSEYQATAATIIPQLASEFAPSVRSTESSWSEAKSEAAFFERLKTQEREELSPRPFRSASAVARRPAGYVPPPARWKEFGMLYAAGILLFLALTIASYRLGT